MSDTWSRPYASRPAKRTLVRPGDPNTFEENSRPSTCHQKSARFVSRRSRRLCDRTPLRRVARGPYCIASRLSRGRIPHCDARSTGPMVALSVALSVARVAPFAARSVQRGSATRRAAETSSSARCVRSTGWSLASCAGSRASARSRAPAPLAPVVSPVPRRRRPPASDVTVAVAVSYTHLTLPTT